MLRNTGNVVGFDPDYVAYSNVVNLMGYYRPFWSVLLGFGLENQLVDSNYSPAPHIMAIWDDPRVGRFGLDFIYNAIMYDPTERMSKLASRLEDPDTNTAVPALPEMVLSITDSRANSPLPM